MENHSIKGSVAINAPLSAIWDAFINPDKVILYTGSALETDWAQGSPITWSGEMHGAKYQNKGKVLENTSNKILSYTYWSGMGGDSDAPENYSEITYTITPIDNNSAELTYERIKIPTAIEHQIFNAHLQAMLDAIKGIAEN
jgi:uncharacterized protein YndB with AHSA1/START domain